jgi:hypothetical protein
MERPQFESRHRKDIFLFFKMSRMTRGLTQTAMQWVWGYNSAGGVDRRVRINYSPSSSDEVKNEWSYTATPSVRIHGVCRDRCTFHTTRIRASPKILLPRPILLSLLSNGGHLILYAGGADKSLARPAGKEATATENFDFHISYLQS